MTLFVINKCFFNKCVLKNTLNFKFNNIVTSAKRNVKTKTIFCQNSILTINFTYFSIILPTFVSSPFLHVSCHLHIVSVRFTLPTRYYDFVLTYFSPFTSSALPTTLRTFQRAVRLCDDIKLFWFSLKMCSHEMKYFINYQTICLYTNKSLMLQNVINVRPTPISIFNYFIIPFLSI